MDWDFNGGNGYERERDERAIFTCYGMGLLDIMRVIEYVLLSSAIEFHHRSSDHHLVGGDYGDYRDIIVVVVDGVIRIIKKDVGGGGENLQVTTGFWMVDSGRRRTDRWSTSLGANNHRRRFGDERTQ